MWGNAVRFGRDPTRHAIPGWLLNSGATHHTTRYVDRMVAELHHVPDRYGFDPEAHYTALIQTWDTALHNMRSLAYGRRRVGESLVGLMPDPYYIAHEGYRQLRHEAQYVPSWRDREPLVVWRGSVTGAAAPSVEDVPRIALALACRDIPGADVRIFGVHPTMANAFPRGIIEEKVTAYGLEGDRWYMTAFANHRYVIDIDGHANAWGFLEKLILGCCVLKVGSVFEQWFYSRLRPWVHYVPVRGDLSDLREVVDWCYAHDGQCAWIAANAARVSADMTFERELPRSCRALLDAAYMEPPERPVMQPVDRARLSMTLFADAERYEGIGRFDLAMEEYGRISAAGQGGVNALLRLATLQRQQGDYASALATLSRADALEPLPWHLLYEQAQLATGLAREGLAAELLARALRLAPQANDVRALYAAVCLRLDWIDLAAHLSEALPAGSDHWWVRSRAEALTVRATCRTEALALLRECRLAPRDTAAIHRPLVRRLSRLGRLSIAERLCAALGDASGDVAAVTMIARIRQRTHGSAEALRFLRQRRRGDATSVDLNLEVARLELETGNYQGVLAVLDERSAAATDARPEETFGARMSRALALIGLRRLEALREHCARWLAGSYENHPAALVIGVQSAPVTPVPAEAAPTIVHYLEDDTAVARASPAMLSWATFHPDAPRQVFDPVSACAYLRREIGADAARAFTISRAAGDRSALIALAFLYREGGVYIDGKERCLKAIPADLAAAARSDIALIRSEEVIAYVHDVMVGARAGTGVVADLLTALVADILSAGEGEPSRSWSDPWARSLTVGRHLADSDSPERFQLTPFTQYRARVTRDA